MIVRRAEDIADRAVRVLIDGDEAVLRLAVYIVVAEGREQKAHRLFFARVAARRVKADIADIVTIFFAVICDDYSHILLLKINVDMVFAFPEFIFAVAAVSKP